jgi:membrane protease YdiL (CAAX protease family)
MSWMCFVAAFVMVRGLVPAAAGTSLPVLALGLLGTFAPSIVALGLTARSEGAVWPRFGVEPWYILAIATVLSTPVQAGEELGWRGYALPLLAARLGLGRASLLLGIVWGIWHLPLFFVPGIDNYGQSFVIFALQVTAISVPMAWLYARTSGSLSLVMPGAVHALTLSTYLPAWLTVTLLWIAACYFLVRM